MSFGDSFSCKVISFEELIFPLFGFLIKKSETAAAWKTDLIFNLEADLRCSPRFWVVENLMTRIFLERGAYSATSESNNVTRWPARLRASAKPHPRRPVE